jgi:hypothetical protein
MCQSYDLSLSKTGRIADRKDFLSERGTADLLGMEHKLQSLLLFFGLSKYSRIGSYKPK